MRKFLVLLALCAAACSPPAAEAPPPAGPVATPSTSASATATTGITVSAPAQNARLTSPAVATGTAIGGWYFEAIFHARLEALDGALIAEAPAQAQSDWMTPNPVPFRAELPFTVTAETPAILVLEEDNTRGDPNPRQARIAVTLLP